MLRFSVMLLALFVFLGTIEGNPIETTDCELAQRQNDFDGKIVRFNAIFEIDYVHFRLFADDGCFVELGEMDHDEPGVREFMETVSKRELDRSVASGSVASVRVDVSGRFWVNPNWTLPQLLSAVDKPGPHAFFDLSRVWSMTPVADSKHSDQ